LLYVPAHKPECRKSCRFPCTMSFRFVYTVSDTFKRRNNNNLFYFRFLHVYGIYVAHAYNASYTLLHVYYSTKEKQRQILQFNNILFWIFYTVWISYLTSHSLDITFWNRLRGAVLNIFVTLFTCKYRFFIDHLYTGLAPYYRFKGVSTKFY